MKILITGAGALVVGALTFSTPLAHADSGIDHYMSTLAAAGMPGTPRQMISNGVALCRNLRNGFNVVDLATQGAPIMHLTVNQVGFEIGVAIHWLCPEQDWQIKELHDADPSVPGVTAAIAGYVA